LTLDISNCKYYFNSWRSATAYRSISRVSGSSALVGLRSCRGAPQTPRTALGIACTMRSRSFLAPCRPQQKPARKSLPAKAAHVLLCYSHGQPLVELISQVATALCSSCSATCSGVRPSLVRAPRFTPPSFRSICTMSRWPLWHAR